MISPEKSVPRILFKFLVKEVFKQSQKKNLKLSRNILKKKKKQLMPLKKQEKQLEKHLCKKVD